MRAAMEASQEEANKGPPPTKKSVLNSLEESCLDLEDVQNGNDSCTICLEAQHVGDLAVKLPCGHCFHKACVWPWLVQHCTCPVCRLELNDGGAHASNREKAMRRAHTRNMESRRISHAQTVAEQRKRMQQLDREERRISNSSHTSRGANSSNPEMRARDAGGEGKESKSASPGKKRRRIHSQGSEKSNSSNSPPASVASHSGASIDAEEDPVQSLASTLIASGIPAASMQKLLGKLGLSGRVTGAVEKRHLAYEVALASSQRHLQTLKVSELRRRAKKLNIDISTCFDKRGIVELLQESVLALIGEEMRW